MSQWLLHSAPALLLDVSNRAIRIMDRVILLSRRHLSVLNFEFDLIFDGVYTCEEEIALSLKRHLFPHGG